MLYRHKLCMVVVATGHYHFIPIWVTLTAFQGNRSNGEIQMVVCASSVLLTVLVLLHVYTVSALTLHYILLLTPICWKSSKTNARLMAFALSFAVDPTFGIHSHKTLDAAQPCHLLMPNWKPSSSHSISAPTNINIQFLLVCVCVCACVHVCACVYRSIGAIHVWIYCCVYVCMCTFP